MEKLTSIDAWSNLRAYVGQDCFDGSLLDYNWRKNKWIIPQPTTFLISKSALKISLCMCIVIIKTYPHNKRRPHLQRTEKAS